MSFDGLLVQTVDITRRVEVSDGSGGVTGTFTTSSTVRSRIEQQATDETSPPDIQSYHVGFFATGTDIQPEDEVVTGGATYHVVGQPSVVYGRSGPHHIEARLLRVR